MTEITLTGLDGKNPLAFLAALGALEALAEHAREGDPPPRLRWLPGTWRPVLSTALDREGVLAVLAEDLATFGAEPALARLRYGKGGGGSEAHDLKPPPRFFAAYLRGLVEAEAPRSLAFAAAFATDVAVDGNGNAKPTALHFTAGQQELLTMVDELIAGVTPADLEEALFGPWRYERSLPVLGWDNAQARDYALRASDPSKDKKLGVPGADWLAFRGLPFLRVAPVGDRVETTGCQGGWKTGTFRWPLWTTAIPRAVVGSLLVSPELFAMSPQALEARGITVVFEAAIRRSDQGGYGSFAPARVASRV
jgi:hypothetical protein